MKKATKKGEGIFRRTNAVFMRHWWKFILIDFVSTVLFFAFSIYSRAKVRAYMDEVGQYASEISALQMALQQKSVEGMSQLQELLSVVEPIATRMAVFTFLFIPLVIFLIWCLAQALAYGLILDGKLFSVRRFLRITILSLPFFVLALWLANRLLALVYEELFAAVMSWQLYALLFALIMALYAVHLIYSFSSATIGRMAKGLLQSFAGKFPKLFAVFLGYSAVLSFVIGLIVGGFIKYSASSFTGLAFSSFLLVLALAALAWYRAFFTLFAQSAAALSPVKA